MEEPDHFSTFEVRVNRRGKFWKWSVCTDEGEMVMKGVEGVRPAAVYQANRVLFLLLSSAASYRSVGRRDFPSYRKRRYAGPV